jgi:hypothetical protein
MAQCLLVFEEIASISGFPMPRSKTGTRCWRNSTLAASHRAGKGWAPYTHAYRLPDASVYLVALGAEEESED